MGRIDSFEESVAKQAVMLERIAIALETIAGEMRNGRAPEKPIAPGAIYDIGIPGALPCTSGSPGSTMTATCVAGHAPTYASDSAGGQPFTTEHVAQLRAHLEGSTLGGLV